jgi:hypothetical protein
MKFNADNIKSADFSALLNYKIVKVGPSNRRRGNKTFMGKPNCSGYNINANLVRGMSVAAYQSMIRNNFNSMDPQFSLVKHLKYDIEFGFLELVEN